MILHTRGTNWQGILVCWLLLGVSIVLGQESSSSVSQVESKEVTTSISPKETGRITSQDEITTEQESDIKLTSGTIKSTPKEHDELISEDEVKRLLNNPTLESIKDFIKTKLKESNSNSNPPLITTQPFTKEDTEKDTEKDNKSEITSDNNNNNNQMTTQNLIKELRNLINKDTLQTTSESIHEELITPILTQYENMLNEILDEELKKDSSNNLNSPEVPNHPFDPFDSTITPGLISYPLDPQLLQSLYQPLSSKDSTTKEELGTSDHSNATLVSGLSIGDVLVVERCPATQRTYSPSCFCTRIKLWSCPAGSFCLAPNLPRPCPPGFYCPPDTFQPSFCCGGYYCPTPNVTHLCPSGSYCQEGSIAPRTCYFGKCPPGSKTIRKYEVFLFFLGFLVTVWVGHTLHARQVAQHRHAYLRQFRSNPPTPSQTTLNHQKDLTLRFDIKFENLGLRLPDGIEIMKEVTGHLAAGRTCAIMGPSGAGKTTFVSLLTGKVAKTSGTITINGRSDSLSRFRKLVGFVPQDDIMLRQLTVEEILSHTAQLRLPSSWSRQMREAKVMETIRTLGVEGVMHQTVGDEEARGISGGQRKRVNIGMELVADPAILFLDEPTSGLDSATSVEVCSLLANVARHQGLTIAAVIHSPSPPAFSLFDDLLLLGRGGRLLYHGPCADAPNYFAKTGFPVPHDASSADHYMNIASGKVINSLVPDFPSSALFDIWSQYSSSLTRDGETQFDITAAVLSYQELACYGSGHGTPHYYPLSLESNSPLHVTFDDNGKSRYKRNFLRTTYRHLRSLLSPLGRYLIFLTIDIYSWISSVLMELRSTIHSWFYTDPVRVTPGSHQVFQLCFKRALVQIFRSPLLFATDQLLHLGCGLFISIAAQNSVFLGPLPDALCHITPLPLYVKCKRPIIDQAAQIGNFISWGIGFAGISVGAGTFGHERVVYWREASWGVPFLPYFFAKSLADLPRLLTASFMFTLSLVAVYPNAAPFHQLYAIVAALYYWGFSAGYLISAVVRRDRAPLVGVAVALFWALVFSGVQPTLRDIHAIWGPNVQWLWSLSAPRWAIGAFYIAETEAPARAYMDPNHVGRHWFGYHNDTFLSNLGYVLLIAVGWQLFAILSFKLANRDKRL